MSYELSKSIPRRQRDPAFVTRYFVGDGIDVGCGDDFLGQYAEQFPLMGRVQPYDRILGHQDAQSLPEIPDESLDFVNSSHCLEHVPDPSEALRHWLRVLRPGGHIIALVPDEDLYEQGIWPSISNPDHKRTFTLWKTDSWSPVSVAVLDLLRIPGVEVLKAECLTASFRYAWPQVDQTQTPIGECAIEFVIRKRPAAEILMRGRLPTVTLEEWKERHRVVGDTVEGDDGNRGQG